MTAQEPQEPIDSPTGWVNKHIREYVEAAEKPRLWEIMAAIFPMYRDYQRKTDRDIPVVILEPKP